MKACAAAHCQSLCARRCRLSPRPNPDECRSRCKQSALPVPADISCVQLLPRQYMQRKHADVPLHIFTHKHTHGCEYQDLSHLHAYTVTQAPGNYGNEWH